MSTARAVTSNSVYWLALSLTPGLGPTRGRKLVERFATIQDIFHASLTELEAQNLQAQSAQHIALGKSLELAHDEIAKAAAAGVQIVCRADESSTILPPLSMSQRMYHVPSPVAAMVTGALVCGDAASTGLERIIVTMPSAANKSVRVFRILSSIESEATP